jgi:heptosyltransferase-2
MPGNEYLKRNLLMKIKRILVVRNDRFGEFLLNIPAFRALKIKFPQAKISLIANPYVRELAECIDCIDEVIPWENKKHSLKELLLFSNNLRKKKFSLCVIFNPAKEFNLISFLAGIPMRVGYARKWGFLLTHKIPDLKKLATKHEVEYNLDLVKLIGAEGGFEQLYLPLDGGTIKENSIIIHPWTSDVRKQWPAHKFVLLAQRLIHELNLKVIFIGGKDEIDSSQELLKGFRQEVVDLTGKTSLKELARLIKQSRLLISADSGPVHMASCVGTPVIAIFRNDLLGKTATRWGPKSKGSVVLENNDLSAISVEDVFVKAKEILKA